MGVFQSALRTELPMFPWLMANPEHMSNFNDLMMGQRMNRIEWFDFAEVEAILFKEYGGAPEDTLMIDIGGGRGHDLEAFRKKFPQAAGKLILQDLPPVIDDIKELHADIIRMKYDFFNPQPLTGEWSQKAKIRHSFRANDIKQVLERIIFAQFSTTIQMTSVGRS